MLPLNNTEKNIKLPTSPPPSKLRLFSLSPTARPISPATVVETIISMPLGWYLAQGLIPLGPSSSDDEDGPCELPNGRLVCGPHGQVVCGRCCVDYSFDCDSESEDEDKDKDDKAATEWHDLTANLDPDMLADMLGGPRLTKGTGSICPTKFVPPSASVTPSELFTGKKVHGSNTRQVNAEPQPMQMSHSS